MATMPMNMNRADLKKAMMITVNQTAVVRTMMSMMTIAIELR